MRGTHALVCTRVRDKTAVCGEARQSEILSKLNMNTRPWGREQAKESACMFFIYICVYVCVHTWRLVQQDRQRIYMQATMNTSVQDGDRAQEKAWGRWGWRREKGRMWVWERQSGTPGITCARELELYVPEWVNSPSLVYTWVFRGACVKGHTRVYKQVWNTYKLWFGRLWLYAHMWHVFIHTAWAALTLNSCLLKASQKQLTRLSSLRTKFPTHTWLLKQETQLAILHETKPHTQQILFSCLSSINSFFFIPAGREDIMYLQTG